MSSGEATRRQQDQDTNQGDQNTDVNRKQGQNPGQNQGQQNPGQHDPSKSGQPGQNREGDQQKKSGTDQDESDMQRKGNR